MSLLRNTLEVPKATHGIKNVGNSINGDSSDSFVSKIQRRIIKFIRDESTTLQELGMDKTVAAVD